MGEARDDDPRMGQVLAELEAARFIARASAALAQVVDYESTLERIASLAVPAFSDWFAVHVPAATGRVRRFAVRHRDPAMLSAAEAMYREYPPDEDGPYGAPWVLATGEPLWAPRCEERIPEVARDARHARLIGALGLRSFICVPMRSHGRVMGALTFATAESGREYTEIHLHAAQDLAARCAIAIENAELLERLREADRRKDEFLAMLSHELRNPLAPIRNAVEILRARPAGGPEGQWLNDVLDRQVRHLSRLVDDLLDISRITSGRIDLRKERVALASVLSAAVETSRPAIERGRHRLSVELPDEPIEIEGDAVRLSQVFSNLVNNAARYSEPGGRIAIAAARDGAQAVVRVSDDGPGIAPEMLERIFELFVQAPLPGGASHGGLGIGLTLVRRLVELHGGTVRAYSEGPGRGSEFVVRLPLAVGEAVGSAHGAHAAAAS